MGSADVQSTGDGFASVIVGFRDGITVLDLVGEHDLATAERVSFKIREQAARGCGVVVSLEDTEFLDSALLRTLFRGDREMRKHGRRLVLHLGNCEPVRRLFTLAGVQAQLPCCDSLEEAIELASRRS